MESERPIVPYVFNYGMSTFYDQEALDAYIAKPKCAFVGCSEHTWPGSAREGAFPDAYTQFCYSCAFWLFRADMWQTSAFGDGRIMARCGDKIDCYTYSVDNPMVDTTKTPKAALGYGGRVWHIRYYTGETVETNNLWYGGDVPTRFWNLFQPNATVTSQVPRIHLPSFLI